MTNHTNETNTMKKVPGFWNRLGEFFTLKGYVFQEFFLYTICGIEYYRNYSRRYWKRIYDEQIMRTLDKLNR